MKNKIVRKRVIGPIAWQKLLTFLLLAKVVAPYSTRHMCTPIFMSILLVPGNTTQTTFNPFGLMFVNTSDSAVNLKLHQDYLKSHANLNINTKTYHLCHIWDLQ